MITASPSGNTFLLTFDNYPLVTERPTISELEFSRTETFGKDSLPREHVDVFKEFGVRIRNHEALIFENSDTGEEYSAKFAGMNFYPDNKEANPHGAKDCLENGVAAIGWHTSDPDTDNPAEYARSLIESQDGNVGKHEGAALHFLLWLDEHDIILTMNNMGEDSTAYHYAWVESKPLHKSQAEDEDLHEALERSSFGFYRHVDWVGVPQKEAPGPVTSMVVRGQTLVNKDMDVLSKHQIFEQFSSEESDHTATVDDRVNYDTFGDRLRNLGEKPTKANSNQLLDGLSTESSHSGLEDAVCSYIQHETGTKLKPATQYNPVIEYLFRGIDETGEPVTFGVQVKKGGFSSDDRSRLKRFADNHDHLYLFSASGDIIEGNNITNLSESQITEYLCKRTQELDPTEIDRLRRRVEIFEAT